MATDLQELVDDLAALIARPVALDDRGWHLLAASAYVGDDDPVRRHSLLSRTASEEVAAWLDSLGLERQAGLVETPENEQIGMRARVVAPVRHDEITLGFLWVIAGDAPLEASEREALAAAAEDAARILWERRARRSEEHRHEAELLGELLDAPDPQARERAAAALGERPGWDAASFALALGRLPAGDTGADVGEAARRHWLAGELIWRARGGELTVLARLSPSQSAADVATLLERAGAHRAVAAPLAGLEPARDVRGEAADGLLVLERVPGLGPSAELSALGAWPLAARLWSASGRPALPEPVGALLEHRSGPLLIEALESVLDAAGDVAGAAGEIHVHRSTLYRRLETAEELTGLSLERGDDRLRLHLALRMWRLN